MKYISAIVSFLLVVACVFLSGCEPDTPDPVSRTSRADEYRECAKVAAALNLDDMESVQLNNRAVDKMDEIFREAAKQGETAIDELIPLLDEPETAK